MKTLYLPALTGQFSNWRYYQAIIKVSSLVEKIDLTSDNYRIKTTDEVEEINSFEINQMLQRVFDSRRLEPLKNYLIKQSDKYLNNITVAIYGGNPEWLPIGLKALGEIEDYEIEKIEEIEKTFGLIKLRGDETLFVLDGQHRIKALREAVELDNDLLSQDISLTLISHSPDDDGRKATRRLFTTINRYAKPVSFGETILLDEDDLSAIITRELINSHPILSINSLIAQNKTADLKLPKDNEKFTTSICLYNINELIIDKNVYPSYEGKKDNLVRVRPEDEIFSQEKEKIFRYWDLFFEIFDKALEFANSPKDFRLREDGNLFFLRPIGQEIIFSLILELEKQNLLSDKIDLFNKIESDLNSEFWKFILFDPYKNRMIVNKSLAKYYLYYHFGLYLSTKQLESLKSNYRKNSGELNLELPVSLSK